jgi:hypothetical protein
MQIARENARHFKFCNLNFAFCPAEAGKSGQFFKGLNCYPFFSGAISLNQGIPSMAPTPHFPSPQAMGKKEFFNSYFKFTCYKK